MATVPKLETVVKYFNLEWGSKRLNESGQKAALRIAEKLFSLINETNKIFFSIVIDII